MAAALLGYWMSAVVLVVSLQTVVAGIISVYLSLMSGMGLAESPGASELPKSGATVPPRGAS